MLPFWIWRAQHADPVGASDERPVDPVLDDVGDLLAELHALDEVAGLAQVGDVHVALGAERVVEHPGERLGVGRRGVLHPRADPHPAASPGEIDATASAASGRDRRDEHDRDGSSPPPSGPARPGRAELRPR